MKKEYTECIVETCHKPLGHDTKELDFRVCTDHRSCAICTKPLTPTDVRICHDKSIAENDSLELAHSRCLLASGKLATLDSDPTLSLKQSTYDLLNAARLMVDPDMSLSQETNEMNAMIYHKQFVHEMNFDQRYMHLIKLEACVASARNAINNERSELKKRADARESDKFKKAQTEAKTSSRPTSKPATDSDEIALANFMGVYGITERKTAMKVKRDRDKAINDLVKLGMDINEVTLSVDKEWLRKNKNA